MHSFEVHSNESECRKKVCLGLEQFLSWVPVAKTKLLQHMCVVMMPCKELGEERLY